MTEVKSRRTNVSVSFEGADITDDIKKYFLALEYTDAEEDESDTLKIDLQDRDGVWLTSWINEAVAATAAQRLKISAVIRPEGWGVNQGGPLPTGEFELDGVGASGPPGRVTLQAAALSFGSSIRQTKKSKAWENYTLQGIAAEIASKNGYTLVYEAEYSPAYKRKEQNKKSDIKFLSELCHDAGISLKCTDGKIVLFDQRKYEAMEPVLTICRHCKNEKGKIAQESYTLDASSAETQYGSCRVSYVDPSTGKCIIGTATADGEDGSSGQVLEITARVQSTAEAQNLAAMQLRLHNKFNRKASFTVAGNTRLVAGVTVMVEGFGGWDGKYIVKQAKHSIGEGGYTTAVDLRQIIKQTAPVPSAEPEKKSTRPTVQYGSRGSDVSYMQQCLVDLGYSLPRYGVDGVFMSETLAAVKAFQADHGLEVDGVCGPLTWTALEKAAGKL